MKLLMTILACVLVSTAVPPRAAAQQPGSDGTAQQPVPAGPVVPIHPNRADRWI